MLTKALRLIVAHKPDKYSFVPFDGSGIDFFSLPQELGLYIHIPFCRSICPYCPYNKILYDKALANQYYTAILNEFELYLPFLKGKELTSIYIGGGTPTLMIEQLTLLLSKIKSQTGFNGDIGIEIHPHEAKPEIFAKVKQANINLVSIGVQSFNSSSLCFLERGYDSEKSHQAVMHAIGAKFDTVDIDLMYNIPGQTEKDIKEDLTSCLLYGVDQVSIYPLIIFPLTPLHEKMLSTNTQRFSEIEEYKLQKTLDKIATSFGYERTSIWTYAKKNTKRYTSVTRETFLGLGASATSLYNDYFYLNTFSVEDYIKTVGAKRFPISLVNYMNTREKQVFWLFWRCYDTVIPRQKFCELFGTSLDKNFPLLVSILKLCGLAKDDGATLKLTGLGSFCYHFIEKQYSLKYLNALWEESMKNSWPKRLDL